MSSTAKHLLHLLALALFLYFLAFIFQNGDGESAIFWLFLASGAFAELAFWVGLFKSFCRRDRPA